jgi:hypothetical protein
MNFAVHVAVFLASNSGLWFFHNLNQAPWPWLLPLSGIWLVLLLLHLLYIAVLADYSVKSNG